MYKIFFNESELLITKKPVQNTGCKVKSFEGKKELKKLVERFKQLGKAQKWVVLCAKPKRVFKLLKKEFKYVKAAGGLVFNDDKFLVISRLSKWDLPKGHIEIGETSRQAALREVEEECGITGMKIVKLLKLTYHIYKRKKYFLKRTIWYEMQYAGNEPLKPQKEEGIVEARWLPFADRNMLLENTFPSIKELIEM